MVGQKGVRGKWVDTTNVCLYLKCPTKNKVEREIGLDFAKENLGQAALCDIHDSCDLRGWFTSMFSLGVSVKYAGDVYHP